MLASHRACPATGLRGTAVWRLPRRARSQPGPLHVQPRSTARTAGRRRACTGVLTQDADPRLSWVETLPSAAESRSDLPVVPRGNSWAPTSLLEYNIQPSPRGQDAQPGVGRQPVLCASPDRASRLALREARCIGCLSRVTTASPSAEQSDAPPAGKRTPPTPPTNSKRRLRGGVWGRMYRRGRRNTTTRAGRARHPGPRGPGHRTSRSHGRTTEGQRGESEVAPRPHLVSPAHVTTERPAHRLSAVSGARFPCLAVSCIPGKVTRRRLLVGRPRTGVVRGRPWRCGNWVTDPLTAGHPAPTAPLRGSRRECGDPQQSVRAAGRSRNARLVAFGVIASRADG